MKIPWFKIFRVILFLIVAIVTIGTLAIAWFGYQGRKEWAKTRTELLARGEKLALSDMIPPEIPPEENFFADPLWEEAFDLRVPESQQQISQLARTLNADEIQSLEQRFPEFAPINAKGYYNLAIALKQWATKPIGSSVHSARQAAFILALLEPSEPILQRFAELAKRPSARPPLRYEEGFFMSIPHVSNLLKAAQLLRLRAEARLTLGDSTGALADTLLIFRLSEILKTEQNMISFLVRNSMNRTGLQVVGYAMPLWSEADLKKIEFDLAKIDLVAGFARALRGERGMMNAIFDALRQNPDRLLETLKGSNIDGSMDEDFKYYAPISFFIDTDQTFFNRNLQEWMDSLEGPHSNLKSKVNGISKKIELLKANSPSLTLFRHLLSCFVIPSILHSSPSIIAFSENQIGQAILACALQRWLLANGSLPDKLDALVPDYLPALPSDIMTGAPMHYRRTSDNTYDLWSVGWNEIDENGKPYEKQKMQEADWVWNSITIK